MTAEERAEIVALCKRIVEEQDLNLFQQLILQRSGLLEGKELRLVSKPHAAQQRTAKIQNVGQILNALFGHHPAFSLS
jgi:hypothetical protein